MGGGVLEKIGKEKLAGLLLEFAVDSETPEDVLEPLWKVIKYLKGVKPTKPRGDAEEGGDHGKQEA